MYRLACYGDKDYEREDVRYIQKIATETVISGLHFVYRDSDGKKPPYFFEIMAELDSRDFFDEISEYISGDFDYEVGVRLVQEKTRRMLEKMEDPNERYTFDIFEEFLLYYAILICRQHKRAYRKHPELYNREREEEVAQILMEKYHYKERKARKTSRQILRFSEMMLKDDEDSNMYFWDEDFLFIFDSTFVQGIKILVSAVGDCIGYGYDYTCKIFTDIGLKPPIMLLGTKEANRIRNEMMIQKAKERPDGPFGWSGEPSNTDIDDDLPFN